MNCRPRSLASAIRGPITLITVGVLFALNNFTAYTFDKTWPVLLIVFGMLSLIRRGVEPEPPAPYPPGPVPPQYNFPPPPPASGGGYARSSYSAPPPPPPGPAAPAKGGLGTSAPPRPESTSGD